VGALILALGPIFFALTGTRIWQAAVAMGLTGIGVGGTFAVMPMLVISAVDPAKTSSSLGLYQVLRYVGFSFGSALSATVLVVGAHLGTPGVVGYRVGLGLSAGICVLAAGLAVVLSGPQRSVAPTDVPLVVEPGNPAGITGGLETL
jgi:MFS family permease